VVLATTADSASAISSATVAPGDQNPLGDVATALVIDLDTNSPFTISGGGEVAVVACLADGDCNDGNPCTLDQCGADNTRAHPAGTGGVTCRPSAGPCDIEEHCSGTSTDCPADTFLPTTEVCRLSAGVCDAAEHCTGTSAACPADAFLPSTTVCRSAAGSCD